MDRMLYVAMSGAKQAMEQQASVANNMANVSTPGFRAQINSFRAVPVVGDALRDLQAGVAVGCRPHLVRTGKGAQLDDAEVQTLCAQVPGTVVHADLAAFAEHMIRIEREGRFAAGGVDPGSLD